MPPPPIDLIALHAQLQREERREVRAILALCLAIPALLGMLVVVMR